MTRSISLLFALVVVDIVCCSHTGSDLDLSGNLLNGTIPTILGAWSSLRYDSRNVSISPLLAAASAALVLTGYPLD